MVGESDIISILKLSGMFTTIMGSVPKQQRLTRPTSSWYRWQITLIILSTALQRRWKHWKTRVLVRNSCFTAIHQGKKSDWSTVQYTCRQSVVKVWWYSRREGIQTSVEPARESFRVMQFISLNKMSTLVDLVFTWSKFSENSIRRHGEVMDSGSYWRIPARFITFTYVHAFSLGKRMNPLLLRQLRGK